MAIKIEASTTSIATCMDIVKKIRERGILKKQILIITNHAGREAIIRNNDLRRSDGSVFSTHTLIANVRNVITLPTYQATTLNYLAHNHLSDPVADYKDLIESGGIVVAILEDHYDDFFLDV